MGDSILVPSQQATIQDGIDAAINGEGPASIIEGFSITNGYGPFENDNYKGGGIYCNESSPPINDCIFDNNIGRRNGGAISGWGSSPAVNNCIFTNNYAIHGAAAYFNGVPYKDKASIAVFNNCKFDSNIGISDTESYAGAILIQYGNMALELNGCLISNNVADITGAVSC